MRFGIAPIYKNKRAQDYKCKVLSNGWVWGIF
jgi:hypothetical protein